MGFNVGQFDGKWSEHRPTWISGAKLWINPWDTSKSLTRGQYATNYPYIVRNVTTGGEVTYLLDATDDKEENWTIAYQSDFTVDRDGWTDFLTAARFSAPAEIGGFSDCLKFTDDNVNGSAYVAQQTGVDSVFEIDWWFYVPVENTVWTTIQVGTAGGGFDYSWWSGPIEKGKWKRFRVRSADWRGRYSLFVCNDAGGQTTQSTESVYFKDITVREWVGKSFRQEDRNGPTPDWSWSEGIVFDGSTKFMTMPDASAFTTDTQGEWFSVVTCPSVEAAYVWGIEQDSSVYHYFGVEPEDGSMRLTVWNGSNKLKGHTTLWPGDTYVLNVSSDGTRTRMSVNEEEQIVEAVTGTNDGSWFDVITDVSVAQKGRFTAGGVAYGRFNLEEEVYFGEELTPKRRRAVHTNLKRGRAIPYYNFRPEVRAVFDRMQNPQNHTGFEKVAMDRFVSSQLDSSNWDLLIDFGHLGLQDPSNALTGWKFNTFSEGVTYSGGDPIHVPGEGYTFDGSSYLISDNNDLGMGTDESDGMYGVYIRDFSTGSTGNTDVAGWNNSDNRIASLSSTNRVVVGYYNGSISVGRYARTGGLTGESDIMVITGRDSSLSTGVNHYENAVSQTPISSANARAPAGSRFYLGARRSPPENFTGSISSYVIGKEIGFDHTDFYDNLRLLNHELEGYSHEAARVFVRMNNDTLSTEEKQVMDKFITSQVRSDNWQKIQEFAYYGLADEQNSLTGWKLFTQVAHGSPVHTPGVGFNFLGTQYINTNYNPFDNSIYHQLGNMMMGIYIVVDNEDNTNFRGYMGAANTTDGGSDMLSLNHTTGSTTEIRLNANNTTSMNTATGPDQVWTLSRTSTASTGQQGYMNGEAVSWAVRRVATAIPDSSMFVGARSAGSTGQPIAGSFPSYIDDASIGMFVMGQGIGFDHVNFYENFRIFLQDINALDVINYSAEAIEVFQNVNMTESQKERAAEFVDTLVQNGIWEKVYSFNWYRNDNGAFPDSEAVKCWKGNALNSTYNNGATGSSNGVALDGVNQFVRTGAYHKDVSTSDYWVSTGRGGGSVTDSGPLIMYNGLFDAVGIGNTSFGQRTAGFTTNAVDWSGLDDHADISWSIRKSGTTQYTRGKDRSFGNVSGTHSFSIGSSQFELGIGGQNFASDNYYDGYYYYFVLGNYISDSDVSIFIDAVDTLKSKW